MSKGVATNILRVLRRQLEKELQCCVKAIII